MNGLLRRIGLRLADARDEDDFFTVYARRNLAFARLMLAFGGVLFLLFWE